MFLSVCCAVILLSSGRLAFPEMSTSKGKAAGAGLPVQSSSNIDIRRLKLESSSLQD